MEARNTNGMIVIRNTMATQCLPEKICKYLTVIQVEWPKNIRRPSFIKWSSSLELEGNKINQTNYEKPWFVTNCCMVVTYNNRHEALCEELYKHFHEAQSRASYDISLAYLGFDWSLRHSWKALLQHNWNCVRLPCWTVIHAIGS